MSAEFNCEHRFVLQAMGSPVVRLRTLRTLLMLSLFAACDSPPPGDVTPDSDEELREPDALTGGRVELWLDAAQTSSLTTSGGAVLRWADRSPHHRDAAQSSSGAQPTFSASGLVGLPAITFDGIDDQLLTPAFIEENSYAMFIVAANHDTTLPIPDHVSSVLSTQGCTAGAPGLTLFTYSSTDPKNARIPGVVTGTSMSLFVRVNGVNGGAYGGSLLSQTAKVEVPKDSWVVMSLQTLPRSGAEVPGHGGPALSLGAFRDGCQFGHVSIAEVIVMRGGAPSDVLFDVETYLARKWHVAM
jgi:hypothetical protein